MTALSKIGERQLAEAEATIEAGLATFMEVGSALTLIREGKLYRADHDTFESYCQGRWGFTARRANQLMDAAQIGTVVPVKNEAQARALVSKKDDPTALREAYDKAEEAGDTTAAGLAAALNPSTTETSGEGEPSGAGSAAGEDVAPSQPREASSPSPVQPAVPPLDPVLGYRARASAERSKVRSGLLVLDAKRIMETTDDPKAWTQFAADLLDFIGDLQAQPTTLRAVN